VTNIEEPPITGGSWLCLICCYCFYVWRNNSVGTVVNRSGASYFSVIRSSDGFTGWHIDEDPAVGQVGTVLACYPQGSKQEPSPLALLAHPIWTSVNYMDSCKLYGHGLLKFLLFR